MKLVKSEDLVSNTLFYELIKVVNINYAGKTYEMESNMNLADWIASELNTDNIPITAPNNIYMLVNGNITFICETSDNSSYMVIDDSSEVKTIESGVAHEVNFNDTDLHLIHITGNISTFGVPAERKDQLSIGFNVIEIMCDLPELTTIRTDCGDMLYYTQYGANKLTDCSNMFGILSVLKVEIDVGNATNIYNMFNTCVDLTEVIIHNTGNATNMNSMFAYCHALKKVSTLDISSVTNTSNMFKNCRLLCSVIFEPNSVDCVGADFDFSDCAFDHAGIVEMFESLPTITESHEINLTGTNNAKGVAALTEEEIAIATDKGWAIKTTADTE